VRILSEKLRANFITDSITKGITEGITLFILDLETNTQAAKIESSSAEGTWI